MNEIKIDLEFQKEISPLSLDERTQLESNLIANGCRDPLVIWQEENTLLDGHNRYEICRKHGIDYQVSFISLPDRNSALIWICENQLGRRNLPDAQRVVLAMRRAGLIAQKAKANQGTRTDLLPDLGKSSINTEKEIAKLAGVSHGTVGNVKTVLNHGATALKDAMLSGSVAPSTAASVARLPEVKQQAIVAQGTAAIKQAASEQRKEQAEVRQYAAELPVIKFELPKVKAVRQFVTLADWNKLGEDERNAMLVQPGAVKFNETNDNVEWARWTWNPVTGCLHDCDYCYARDIANRFYDYLPLDDRFQPTFYPDRLSAPTNTKVPDVSQVIDPIEKMGKKNVFVCSMADLFGKWIPDVWIEAVLQQVRNNPQWNFLFLTKFPIRMAEFSYPANAWLGTTTDKQWAVDRAEKAFTKLRNGGYEGIAWLSCEPMLEKLTFNSLEMFDWIVVGGSSKSTQTPEFKPPFDWIVHLWNQAKRHDKQFYMKTNLLDRVREYPVGKS